MKLSFRTIIALLLTIGLLLGISPPSGVASADNPIQIRLGGEGSTRWDISNVKPGDNATKTVTIENAGTRDGYVIIWLADIVSIEGPAGRPGKFKDFLLLDVSMPNLQTNISLPVVMANFPQSAAGSNYVRISRLRAGETTTLVWKWLLPYSTGNEIQGNGVSFSIYYMLAEIPAPGSGGGIPAFPEPPLPPPQPPPTPPPARTLQVNLSGTISTVDIADDGTLKSRITLTDAQGRFSISAAAGTRITGRNGEMLSRIELAASTDHLPIPVNASAISQIYKVEGYTADNELTRIIFDPFAVVTIKYNLIDLPQNALTPYIANYDIEQGFTRLEPPPDSAFQPGQAVGVTFHTSYFVAIAEIAPPPPPLPPNFRLSNLAISPGAARAGQPVTISVDIANNGALTGDYEVYLVIDGIIRAIKQVTVNPSSLITIRFEVANMAIGFHQVQIAGLSGQFRVLGAAVTIPGTTVNWPLADTIVAGIVLTGLIIALALVRRARKNTEPPAPEPPQQPDRQ